MACSCQHMAGWSEDANTAMQNGTAYFKWWDSVKSVVLVGGILAVAAALYADGRSRR